MSLTPFGHNFFFDYPDWPVLKSDIMRSDFKFNPSIDVKETDTNVVVQAELPGIPKEDIHIELDNGYLSISGEKQEEHKEESDKFHRVERSFGKFSRTIRVPQSLKQSDICANFDNGLLNITFPKISPDSSKRSRIQIQ